MFKLIFCFVFVIPICSLSQTLQLSYDIAGNRINKKFTSIQPAKPQILYSNQILTSSYTSGNQWYFNDLAVNGATNPSYSAAQIGKYSVKVNTGSSCPSPMSDYFITSQYTFIGNGNWGVDSNWQFQYKPPLTLPNQTKVYINPISGGECVVTGALNLQNGSAISIKEGKKLTVKP